MNKNAFLWLTIGLGVGLMFSTVYTLRSFCKEHRKKKDPRLMKAEDLLNEAELLLRSAKKGKTLLPV